MRAAAESTTENHPFGAGGPPSDWHSRFLGQKERHEFLIDNQEMSDISFLMGVNRDRVSAHKFLLSTGSPVFYSMFHGELYEKSDEIAIPDLQKDVFINLLRYLYCEKPTLTAETIMGTLYASKKYLVPALTRECVKFLDENLDAHNVLVVLSQSLAFDEKELVEKCWKIVDEHAEVVLRSEAFATIDHAMLKLILSRESLCAPERTVFDAADAWAEAQCQEKSIEATGQNKRDQLKDALYMVRMPLLSIEEFTHGPVKSEILTEKESLDVYK